MTEQPLPAKPGEGASPDEGVSTTPSPSVWMLADDRPGNVNQALGLAEALDEPFVVKTIGYSQIARLPNWLLPANLAGLTPASRERLRPPWPKLVIGAGRRTAPIARWLKQQNPNVCLVQLMWPGSADGFDLIAVPEHDRVPDHPVLLRTVGPPHRIRPALLSTAAEALAPRLEGLPRPYVVCLVGGTSKHLHFTPEDARALIEGALALAEARGGSLLVTTSRRTDRDCILALKEMITAPHFLHCWSPDGDNPYLGMLGSADAVVVSADSASMCTEAVAIGKPAFLHRPAAGIPEKFKLLHKRFFEHGCLKSLGSPWFEVDAPPNNPAETIKVAIKELLLRRQSAGNSAKLAS